MTCVVLLLLLASKAMAQVMDNSRRVERMSFAERLSLRANMTDWVLMVPSIGMEYDLRPENWSRYAINTTVRWRPHTRSTFVHPVKFNLFDVSLEGRMYWRERKAEYSGYLRPHIHWWDKLFSCRNKMPSHPNWIFYRGAFVSYSDYALYLSGHDGHDGKAYMAGLSWGFIKPFVTFQSGNSIDMEFGVSAGMCYTKFDRFNHDKENNTYPITRSEDWHLLKYPMVKDIRMAFVYRFGSYSIRKKYRWRYDVDMAFRARKDSIYEHRLAEKERKFVRDSLYRVVSRDFKQLYDSCVHERRQERQKAINRKAPKITSNT